MRVVDIRNATKCGWFKYVGLFRCGSEYSSLLMFPKLYPPRRPLFVRPQQDFFGKMFRRVKEADT